MVSVQVGPLDGEVVEQCSPALQAHHGRNAEDQEKAQHGALTIRDFGYGEHGGKLQGKRGNRYQRNRTSCKSGKG